MDFFTGGRLDDKKWFRTVKSGFNLMQENGQKRENAANLIERRGRSEMVKMIKNRCRRMGRREGAQKEKGWRETANLCSIAVILVSGLHRIILALAPLDFRPLQSGIAVGFVKLQRQQKQEK